MGSKRNRNKSKKQKIEAMTSEEQDLPSISIDEALSRMLYGCNDDCDCCPTEDDDEADGETTSAADILQSIENENAELKKSAEKWVAWLAEAEWPQAFAQDNKVVIHAVDGKQVHFEPWYLLRLYNLGDEYDDVDFCLDMDALFGEVMWALYEDGGVDKMKRLFAEYEEEVEDLGKPKIDDPTGYTVVG